MAKRKKPVSKELPTMEEQQPEVVGDVDDVIVSYTETAPIAPACDQVTATIPFIPGQPSAVGYQDEANRIDLKRLSKERMRKVKAIRRGYIAADIRMDGGYEVKTNSDALLCLLDQLEI